MGATATVTETAGARATITEAASSVASVTKGGTVTAGGLLDESGSPVTDEAAAFLLLENGS